MDSVNASSITSDTIKTLETTLELKINFLYQPEINNTKIQYPKNNPTYFFEMVCKLKKQHVIISHSNFMTKFYKILPENLKQKFNNKFQNLDIIHMLVDKTTNKLLSVKVREYYKYYNLSDKNENEIYELYNKNPNNINNIFIMRHCVGCHNIASKKSDKGLQFFKQQFYGNQWGYLSHAMCIKETVGEIEEMSTVLLELFDKYGGFKNYNFSSSIIFRAILTGGLLYNVLLDKYQKTHISI
jgi:hypothetical protein